MSHNVLVNMMVATLVVVSGFASESFAQTNSKDLELTAAAGSAEPKLSKGYKGAIVLSWQEPYSDGTKLRFSRLENTGWSKPQTVAQGNDWFVNWADFPSVLAVSEDLRAAHWLRKRPGGVYAYDVMLALSLDKGRTWGKAITPHRDNTATEHGFVSLYPAVDGVGLIWLDGRNTTAAGTGHEHSGSHGGGGMTLRHAVVGADGAIREEQEVDNLVCDCCQTSVAIAGAGPVAVYRNRSEDEIRDIYITRYVDGKWQAGVPVSNDGWKISGCPVNGPAVAASGDEVAVAWFTMADDLPRVRFARSADGGQTFGKVIEIDGDAPSGRVGVALLDNGNAVVSWLGEAENSGGVLRVQVLHPDGSSAETRIVATTKLSRPAGFPQMLSEGNDLIVAWTDTEGQTSRVKSKRIILLDSTPGLTDQ